MKRGHQQGDTHHYKADRELLVSLKADTDLIESVTQIARDAGIQAGILTAIGALKSARLGYYDQKSNEYQEIVVDSPHEMASCLGNISLKNGQPFAHVHVVLADEAGNTKAGHLLEGVVFVAEVHLRRLLGPRLERQHDQRTGLSLWQK